MAFHETLLNGLTRTLGIPKSLQATEVRARGRGSRGETLQNSQRGSPNPEGSDVALPLQKVPIHQLQLRSTYESKQPLSEAEGAPIPLNNEVISTPSM
jgi:hypothetical protein